MHSLRELPVSRAYPARLIRARFRGEELVLGPTLVTDAEEIAEALNQSLPELKSFMPFAHAPQTALTQLERLRGAEADYFAGRDLVMALFRERPGERRELVTMAGLHPRVPLNPRALELGYWTPTRSAGRGYATFAAQALLVYAFDKLGADRVQVMCDEANAKSRRVIDKCGFALEGTLRNVAAAPSPELTAGGFVSSGRNPMFALFPDTFAAQPWVAEVRGALRYVNLAGHEL